MIYAIPHYEIDNHPILFDEMFLQRHRLFVEGRGWKDLGDVSGREIDQFDTTSAIYLMALDTEGSLQGGIRLVPTTSPCMLNAVFQDLCTKRDMPRRIETWEFSRLFVCHHSPVDDEGVSIKGRLMCAMFEFCLQHGIKSLTAIGDTFLLPRVMSAGMEATPLGLPKQYETGEMVAVEMTVSESILGKMQNYYGVPVQALQSDLSLPRRVNDRQVPAFPSPDNRVEHLFGLNGFEDQSLESRFEGKRSQYLSRFANLVQKLSSADQREVNEAELELDRLTEEVLETLHGSKSGEFSKERKTLQ